MCFFHVAAQLAQMLVVTATVFADCLQCLMNTADLLFDFRQKLMAFMALPRKPIHAFHHTKVFLHTEKPDILFVDALQFLPQAICNFLIPI